MRSVLDALEALAGEQGVPVTEIIRAELDEHLDSSLPLRYQRLAADVVLRLPDGWDSHAHWEMCAGDIPDSRDVHQAGARLLDGEPGDLQEWEVRLVPQELDRYPDAAVRWVIAHELAHVGTGLPTDIHIRDSLLCEDRANHLTYLWGFESEREAYVAAAGLPRRA